MIYDKDECWQNAGDIWIGSRQQLAKVDIKEFQLLSANILFSTTVSNLGVHLDSRLTMQDHVAAMCCSCFFQLRQLRTIRSSVTTDAAKTLAQAFVGGRFDYCNSLMYGVSEISCDVCRVSRTRLHGSSLVLGNTITTRQCCATFIGCDKG